MSEHETVWLHAHVHVTLVELAETSGLSESELRDLVDMGALVPADPAAAEWVFRSDCVASLRKAARLCHDLELETGAMALVLTFLERIEHLESEVRHLRAQLVR